MIYNKVIEYCEQNNLSISAFEKMCGIGNGTVAQWNPELDKPSTPSLETLKKIENSTGIPVTELVSLIFS